MTEVRVVGDSADASGANHLGQWSRAPDALSREVRAGVLVLARSSPDPLLLVGAGWVVWHLLAVPMAFDDACRSIAEEFETSIVETQSQLRVLLEQLAGLNLVVQIR